MRALIPLLILVLLTSSFNEISDESSKILWSEDYKLKWHDFQGRPDDTRTSEEESATKTRIEVNTKITKAQIEFFVPCYFEKDKSWAVKSTSPELLNHEQLHFDISEFFARKLRQKLFETKFATSYDIQLKVKEIYHEILLASIDFQNKYDKETNHSKNKDQQFMWNKKVKEMLIKMSNFKTVKVIVSRQ
jgi:hypothetical protein